MCPSPLITNAAPVAYPFRNLSNRFLMRLSALTPEAFSDLESFTAVARVRDAAGPRVVRINSPTARFSRPFGGGAGVEGINDNEEAGGGEDGVEAVGSTGSVSSPSPSPAFSFPLLFFFFFLFFLADLESGGGSCSGERGEPGLKLGVEGCVGLGESVKLSRVELKPFTSVPLDPSPLASALAISSAVRGIPAERNGSMTSARQHRCASDATGTILSGGLPASAHASANLRWSGEPPSKPHCLRASLFRDSRSSMSFLLFFPDRGFSFRTS